MQIKTDLIKDCFELLKPILDQIVARFYENLFLDFPQTKHILIKYDLDKQKKFLINSLITIIENLENKKNLTQFLQDLSEKLKKLPIADPHYDWAAQTFLKTLGQFLGRSWSPDLSYEWGSVFNLIVNTLKQGVSLSMQNDLQHSIVAHSSQEQMISNEKLETSCLTDEFKQNIQNAVKAIVLKQIKLEVEKYLKEELIEISRMTPEELIAVAIQPKS